MARSAYRKNARNKLHSTKQAEVVSREKHDEDQDLSTLLRKCEEQVKKQGEGRSESKTEEKFMGQSKSNLKVATCFVSLDFN